ncbi:MAG: D-glucuronyl C5-epimerase family protein [Ignavibacteriales bacterium]|nr:D-glucuronyl C5-epimerase family protein [Ignavibacteriales bacterium]
MAKPISIGNYYLDFKSKSIYPGKFDSHNIPLYKYEESYIYHPIVISQYALGLYERITENNGELKKFLTQADWLLNNCVRIDQGVYWYLNIQVKEYEITQPWISAMAQGEAISVLTRAFILTQDNKYLDYAKFALVPFYNETSNNGVLSEFNGIKIFEEYPSTKPIVVLNGFIFSLFGLYDLALLNITDAKELFLQGINSIVNLLPSFDINYWTNYDLCKNSPNNPASYTYHMIHIEQLKVLYILTGNKIFLEYALKWQTYSEKFYYKTKALLKKLQQKKF